MGKDRVFPVKRRAAFKMKVLRLHNNRSCPQAVEVFKRTYRDRGSRTPEVRQAQRRRRTVFYRGFQAGMRRDSYVTRVPRAALRCAVK